MAPPDWKESLPKIAISKKHEIIQALINFDRSTENTGAE